MQHGSGPCDVALIPLGTFSHALTNDEACAWLDQAVAALRPSGLLCIELAHPGDIFDGDALQAGACLLASCSDWRYIAAHAMTDAPVVSVAQGDDWTIDDEEDDMLRVEYGSDLDDFDPLTQVMLLPTTLWRTFLTSCRACILHRTWRLDHHLQPFTMRTDTMLVAQVLQRSLVVSRSPEEGKWVRIGEEVVPQRVFTLQEMRLLASRTAGARLVGFYGDYDLEVDIVDADAYRMIVVMQKEE